MILISALVAQYADSSPSSVSLIWVIIEAVIGLAAFGLMVAALAQVSRRPEQHFQAAGESKGAYLAGLILGFLCILPGVFTAAVWFASGKKKVESATALGDALGWIHQPPPPPPAGT